MADDSYLIPNVTQFELCAKLEFFKIMVRLVKLLTDFLFRDVRSNKAASDIVFLKKLH